jgi:colicin import membrane protein
MVSNVSAVLERRLALPTLAPLRRALVVAVVLHAGLAVSAVVVPRLLAPPAAPVEYVAIQIVPAARLGVEQPKPAPEVKKPEPAPEPVKESKAPVLPDPKAKKKPEARKRTPDVVEPEAKPVAEPEVQGSARGVAGGLSIGAPAATFDNPDFTYGYYVDQMLAQISRNWSRPPVGSGVETALHFRIERTGRIAELRIVRSSGINSFDLAALRAVQASSPLPPLPSAYRQSSLGVNLIVR